MIPNLIVPAFGPALPEILLAIAALGLVLFGAISGERSAPFVRVLAVIALLVALVAVPLTENGKLTTFSEAFVTDAFAKFMKVLVLIGSIAAILLSSDYFERERIDRFEYPILIVLATIGMMMVISANDLIALYLGLELFSLSSYVIAAFHRDNLRSTEAGLKYFVL